MKYVMWLLLVVPAWTQSFEPDEQTKAYLDPWRKGEYTKALERLNDAIDSSLDGVPIRWLQDRAQLLFETGRISQAVADLEWLHQRRPTPSSTVQLAEFYYYIGKRSEAQLILMEIDERFKRAPRYEDDTENDLALQRVRELLGENPRVLFQRILDYLPRERPIDHARRYLAAGHLAYRKYDYQLAAENFEKALAINDENVEALAGLAACYWKSADPRLEDALTRVLAINPVHPLAKQIEVELKLDNNKPEEALTHIEEVLAVNPSNLTFIGLKAAAQFLQDRTDEAERTIRQGRIVNPRGSIMYRILGRVASRHYRFEQGLAFQTKALALDPADHEARALMAFDLLRLGRDAEGRTQLEQAFEADRFNVQVYNKLTLMDTLEDFAVIKRGPFELKMPKREVPIWADEALDMLEEAFISLEKKYQVTVKRPVHIQIFDNHDDFMVRSVGLPGSVGHLGICFGQLITMDSPTARDKWGMNWRSVLWHEFVHVITLQKTNNRMARWLSEGLSVYEETLVDPSWGQRLDPAYRAVVADGLPGISEIQLLFNQPKSGAHVMFGYFVSGEFVRFYAERYGFQAIVDALTAIGKGTNTEAALIEAAGVEEIALNRNFHKYLDTRLKDLDNLPDPRLADQPTADGKIRQGLEISPFTDALKKGIDAENDNRMADAEISYLKALKLFPEYVGSDGPIPRLIELYRGQQREEDLEAMLLRALSLDATHFPAARELLAMYEQREDWAMVAEMAEIGLAIDPFDISMNRALADAAEKRNDVAVLSILSRLLVLDQNYAVDYRLRRIDALIRKRRAAEAKRETLQLLEQAPYSWEAQRRLLDLQGGR